MKEIKVTIALIGRSHVMIGGKLWGSRTLRYINPKNVIGFTNTGLPLESTLLTLLRLHSLAFGFETFAAGKRPSFRRL